MLQILIREEQQNETHPKPTSPVAANASAAATGSTIDSTSSTPSPSTVTVAGSSVSSREPPKHAECMEFVLNNRPLDVLIEFAVNDTPPGARYIVLNWIRRFLSCLKHPPLGHASIFQPVQRLVELCNGTIASPYEREEILFLETVAGLVRKDSVLVNLFLKSHHHSAQMLGNWKGLGVNKAPVNNPLFLSTKLAYDSRRISLVAEDQSVRDEPQTDGELQSLSDASEKAKIETCDCDDEDQLILFDAIVSYLDSAVSVH